MVEQLSARQAKFLTWLIYFLLAVLTFIAGWSKVESSQTLRDLQMFKDSTVKEFVSMERYKADCDRDKTDLQRVETAINSLSGKIDILITKGH